MIVVVTLIGPGECFGNPEGTALSITTGVFDGLLSSSQNKLGKLTQRAYRVDKVRANSGVLIDDLIILRPSINLHHKTRATTKDNVEVNVQVRYSLGYVFRWSVLPSDDYSINLKTSVFCIAAPTNQAAAREFIGDILDESIKSHLKNVGRWERIRYSFLGQGTLRKVIFADFGTPDVQYVKRKKVFRLDMKAEEPVFESVNVLVPRFMQL